MKHWVLNVVGGEFIQEVATHAPSIASYIGGGGALIFGFKRDYGTESHLVAMMLETLMEPGDPIDYASYLVTSPGTIKGVKLAPRNVLQTEIVYDEVVANEGSEALARAAGFGLALPNVGGNAGTIDVKNLANASGRVPLPDVAPDAAGLIHDTPTAGVTAVVVQQSPGEHGSNFVSSKALHLYAIPYGRFDTAAPFVALDASKKFYVPTAYRKMQAMVTRFIGDGFAGKVPAVTGFEPPIRDFDGDGALDEVDADPSDPTVK